MTILNDIANERLPFRQAYDCISQLQMAFSSLSDLCIKHPEVAAVCGVDSFNDARSVVNKWERSIRRSCG